MHIIFILLNHNNCQFGWFRGSLDHMKKKSDGLCSANIGERLCLSSKMKKAEVTVGEQSRGRWPNSTTVVAERGTDYGISFNVSVRYFKLQK